MLGVVGLRVLGGGGRTGGDGGALYTGFDALASDGISAAQWVGTVGMQKYCIVQNKSDDGNAFVKYG